MMEVIWVVSVITLLILSLRKVYTMGYRAGASKVLTAWKGTLEEMENVHDWKR